MRSAGKTHIPFFRARPANLEDPLEQDGRKRLTAPDAKTVQKLGLKSEPDARIGFKIKGDIIYAKKQAKAGRAQRQWDTWIGRAKSRKLTAKAALKRLEMRAAEAAALPYKAYIPDSLLQKMQSQIEESGSVRAEDLQALFNTISEAEKTSGRVKAAAAEMNTPAIRAFITALPRVLPQFTQTGVSDFLAFIQHASTSSPSQPDYQKAHEKARAFAENWVAALPQDALGRSAEGIWSMVS